MAPTAFPALDDVLAQLVTGAREILGESFCGAYLQGSFAVGDADEHSDVDFIIVTHDEVDAETASALQAMHQRIHALETTWAQHLEGSYVPKERLRAVDPSRAPWLYLDNGATEFQWDSHDNTAVVRWSLREHGVVLAGPDPKELVEVVSPPELRDDVVWALDEWGAWLRTLESWSARNQGLVVLSYCRMLHTLESGRVSSKREAGEWALGALDPEWRRLIQRALEDRADPWTKVRRPADPSEIARTLAFIDYAVRVATGSAGTRPAAR